jgi:hypothetical protein
MSENTESSQIEADQKRLEETTLKEALKKGSERDLQ